MHSNEYLSIIVQGKYLPRAKATGRVKAVAHGGSTRAVKAMAQRKKQSYSEAILQGQGNIHR